MFLPGWYMIESTSSHMILLKYLSPFLSPQPRSCPRTSQVRAEPEQGAGPGQEWTYRRPLLRAAAATAVAAATNTRHKKNKNNLTKRAPEHRHCQDDNQLKPREEGEAGQTPSTPTLLLHLKLRLQMRLSVSPFDRKGFFSFFLRIVS